MIEVNNISKRFGQTQALKNVSFDISPGEIVGLLGPNGAGKTTAMRIMTGFLYPTEGEVFISEKKITEAPLEAKRKIGYLPENNPLYTDLTVYEYLTFIANIRKIPAIQQQRELSRIGNTCGISTVVNDKVGTLSKGFRQRVGLSAALLHNPDILILDEPTAGLDPNQIAEIRGLVREIGREKTIILSSHILSEVAAVCDRAIIINDGVVVAKGSIGELEQYATMGRLTKVVVKRPSQSTLPSLNKIKTVTEVIEEPLDSELSHYAISSTEDIREDIFALAVTNQWVLLELKEETPSLEDVFHELTRKEE